MVTEFAIEIITQSMPRIRILKETLIKYIMRIDVVRRKERGKEAGV